MDQQRILQALWAVGFLSSVGVVMAEETANKPATPSPERMQALIQQLGAPSYVARERAQSELAELGLDAFEALFDAQENTDAEIASRARYLVRGMQVRWFADSDPPDARRILHQYGDLNALERQARIDKLTALAGVDAVPAICRLARFETDAQLSKYVALKLMDKEPPATPAARTELAQAIETAITNGQRPAMQWLRAYVATLRDPEQSLAAWQKLVDQELDAWAKKPAQTNATLCRDLLRWHIKLLTRLERKDEANLAIAKAIDLVDGSKEQLLELADWLVTREAWGQIIKLQEGYAATFNDHPALLYRLALAQQRLGQQAAADETAAKALETRPEALDEHLIAGYSLKEIGLFGWAEKEFRLVMKTGQTGSVYDLRARFILSEMLHDLQREPDAADTLQGVVDALEKDQQVAQRVEAMREDVGSVYSRMYYFRAQLFLAQGDLKRYEELLDKAAERDSSDADVLIALYRLPNATAERRAKTKELIETAANEFRAEIDEYRKLIDRAPNDAVEQAYNQRLAMAYNQFAWLVGNTTGDYDEALLSSQRSLELRPNEPGYLDTLGRCYYAKRDFENAIKSQQEAVRLDPHSGQLRRQLAFFEAEQKAAQQSAPPKQP